MANALTNLGDQSGAPTPIDVDIARPFGGANTIGPTSNALGFPAQASEDSCWVGSANGHAAGLSPPGELVLRQVPAGAYLVRPLRRAAHRGRHEQRPPHALHGRRHIARPGVTVAERYAMAKAREAVLRRASRQGALLLDSTGRAPERS